jgi:hypothetical protein
MSASRGGDARGRDAETRRAAVDGDVGAHRGVVGRSGARVGDCGPGGAARRAKTRSYATGTRYNTMDAR